MSCIMTVLTVMSVFSAGQWNDVEISSKSKFVYNMHEQVSSKIEMITDTYRKSETIAVTCGEEVKANTTTSLEEHK